MVSVGSATLPGTRYGALNQDYVITDSIRWSDGRPPCYMAIVMDGHGMLGEEAARIAGDTILASLKTAFGTKSLENLKEAEVERIFTDAFETAHTAALDAYTQAPTYYVYPKDHALERRYTLGSHAGHAVYRHPITGPRVLEYGTTAAAVVVQGRWLAVGHVGDSLVVLGKDDGSVGYEAEVLTERHSGVDEAERHRLMSQWGGKVQFKDNNDGYVYVHSILPGISGTFSLAMTRALGHRIMQEYGVIPQPTVTLRRLTSDDVCVVVASDGVWEALSATEAVATVCDSLAEGASVDDAARSLCQASVAVVHACGRNSQPDNTTAALVIFDEIIAD